MVGATIEKYTHRDIDAQDWETVRDFCVAHSTAYHAAYLGEARKFMGAPRTPRRVLSEYWLRTWAKACYRHRREQRVR